ncbi:MAG: conserved rane protein of unknown function [Candidatus Saccharibacteria bacterium]|nr:conserved rane protein of unknown function [Candidatus Saccharibacteria bacterium]
MTFIVAFLVIISVLFVIAYISNRRFGIRGLALVSGAMISSLWVSDLTPLIAQAGLVLVQPPLETVVSVTLTLLPAMLLLSSGQQNKSTIRRILGALLFALLAVSLLLTPIGAALVVENPGDQLYMFMVQYRDAIITICLIAATIDLAFTKIPKIPTKH